MKFTNGLSARSRRSVRNLRNLGGESYPYNALTPHLLEHTRALVSGPNILVYSSRHTRLFARTGAGPDEEYRVILETVYRRRPTQLNVIRVAMYSRTLGFHQGAYELSERFRFFGKSGFFFLRELRTLCIRRLAHFLHFVDES